MSSARLRATIRNLAPRSPAVVELAKITMIEAIAMAHGWEMQHDDSVVVIGQDVGANGGVFRATAGLQSRFGADRVQDTPLAEAAIAGMSVGMATHGLKPVAEIQFMGFMYPALDQIVNHMTRMRYRTRGRLSCPVVIRTPHGGGIHAPEHHSESTETLLCHIPGIRVVCPSSPARAYGLLLAAIRDPDPVMFLEPVRLYRAMRQEVTDDGRALPLDRCFILREGDDVTLVTWGAMTLETLRAAAELETQGIAADVIDLATLSPIDSETILESVSRTGRLVIVHEAARNVGVGAEIAALVAEHGLYDLKAPIRRVAGFDTIMPLFRLEHDYIPSVQRILDAVQLTLAD
jgi:2-oxoisovalerate dehydrogenase E1 component beta subunit